MSTKASFSRFIALAGLFAISSLTIFAQSSLWQIGIPDKNNSEFAFAPSNYQHFQTDGFFVVGDSDPSIDWPYVHPGPQDGWAGNRSHTFSVIFGISDLAGKNNLSAGRESEEKCKLLIYMVDTHKNNPTLLNILINGHSFEQKLPEGAGDESIYGSPEKGKPYRCIVEFPFNILKKGNNEIDIVNIKGSWFLYDAIELETSSGIQTAPVDKFLEIGSCEIEPAIFESDGSLVQNLSMNIKYAGGSKKADWWFNDGSIMTITLLPGIHQYKCTIPEVKEEQSFTCKIKAKDQILASHDGHVRPSGHKTIYILPHSHTDIGYTDIQTAIEEKQIENLRTGIQYAQETADYPEGARFVWNIEVSWAADLYLNRLGKEDRDLFFEAIEKGWISLNGMYLNELTGLCRPEELLRLFSYSAQMAKKTGISIDAAMISDVPGYTWGTVTAMAQAGIKYFSVAPNYFDRIGDILLQWENKPFYWVSPSGKEKVLVWIPFKGYAWSHTIPELNNENAGDFLDQLEKMNYPYDISYMRWSGHGDNAVPEKQISDFVRDWNSKYTWPRFVISSTSEAFSAFESRYGELIPEVHGDWTPYWEDGAGSSARETAMNRNTADRLTQAEALFAMGHASSFPVEKFEEAWKKTLLYSEHTWGAWCSITDPENQMTTEQWEIKKGYADEAASLSRELLNINLLNEKPDRNKKTISPAGTIEIVNSTAWDRSEPVILTKEISEGAQSMLDNNNNPLPSQRLSTGEMIFIPEKVPSLSVSTYKFSSKSHLLSADQSPVKIIENRILENGLIRIGIDPLSGDIVSFQGRGIDGNLADPESEHKLNQYLFLEGDDLKNLKTSSPATIRVIEAGPVYGVIEVGSQAPGCNSLTRRYKLALGMDYLEIENIVDKKRVSMPEKIGDWYLAQNENKESVNFAFPFAVPEGIMQLDLPIGSMVPWIDQIPSACKNWYTVGRYGDISNERFGVTWFTLDAPLVEVGEISATLIGSQSNPGVWRKSPEPTQTLYSWAMNNHWGTNYRQHQEGQVKFRYALRPHKKFDPSETYRIATGMTQPLLVSSGGATTFEPPFQIQGEGIVVLSVKPADKGKGLIARLYNPSASSQTGKLLPPDVVLWLSNTAEEKVNKIENEIELGGMELITVRIDRQ